MTWTMPQHEASTCGLTRRKDFLNNKFKRIGVKFEDGPSFRMVEGQIVKSDKETARLLDAKDPTQITNLQIAYYMAKPNKLDVDASDLQMVTSPMELETYVKLLTKW